MTHTLRRYGTPAGGALASRIRCGGAARAIVSFALLLLAGGAPAIAAETADLSALATFIERNCDFSANAWCQVETANAFTDVQYPKVVEGVSGCCQDPKKVFTDFNGMAFDGRNLYFHGGGHASYGGNEVYRLDLATLEWTRLNDPAPLTNQEFIGPDCPVPEIEIYAGHTYGAQLVYGNELHVWSAFPKCDGHKTRGPPLHGVFDLATQEWNPRQPVPDAMSAVVRVEDWAVLFGSRRSARAYRYDLSRGKVTDTLNAAPWLRFGSATVAGTEAVLFSPKKGVFAVDAMDFDNVRHVADLPDSLRGNGGVAFDTTRGRFFFWSGGAKVFSLDRDYGTWRVYPAPRRSPPNDGHIFSKWKYIADFDVFIGVVDHDDIWLYRPEEPRDVETALGEYDCSDEVPSAECPNLQNAINSGETVTLQHGVYRQCATVNRPVTIEGNGAVIRGVTCGGKAAFVTNADTTIRNLTCERHRVSDGNGACVRQQAGSLTLVNVEIRESQNGVLGKGGGPLSIRNSRFTDLGGDCSVKCGRAHGVYYSGPGLTIRDSTFRRPRDQGHLVKSGAEQTLIENSTLDETGGNGSRIIDAYNGGNVTIRDSKLIAARNDGNPTVIGYDYEARAEPKVNRIVIEGGSVDCAGGKLIAGRGSFEAVVPRITTELTACR